jgi:4-hydroxybenzoyl-CoA thioesterase
MNFQVSKRIRIQHCDPAGLVFTPQYFNLCIEVLEDWFEDLDYGYTKMIRAESSGTPAMKITAKFHKTSILGDTLDFSLSVMQLRSKSALLSIKASCNKEKRCQMEFLYGFAQLKEKGLQAWPVDLAEKMSKYLV